jgi:hypothetical protein
MKKAPVSRSAVVLLIVVAVLAISLIALSTASTTLLAAEPEDPYSSTGDIEAQATPVVVTTAAYDGHIDSFAVYRECLTDTTVMQMWHVAILTSTVDAEVPSAGHYELRSVVAPSVDLPIYIEFDEGHSPTSTTISLSGSENIDVQLQTSSKSFYYQSTDHPLLYGTKDVGHTGCMTISSGGLVFNGSAPADIYALDKTETFLPIIQNAGPTPTPTPRSGYYDDFSNPNSGWPRGQFGHCSYDYYYDYSNQNWYYRITADNGERCIIPAPYWATQTDGAFEVRVARASYSYSPPPVMYGFLFRAGTDSNRNHWAVEARPDRVACGNLPFYWLSYVNNGRSKLLNPGAESCTNDLYTGSGWNNLKAISSGGTVWVYLNDKLQMSGSGGPTSSSYKYFDLEAIADSNTAVTVYFDWVRFTPY